MKIRCAWSPCGKSPSGGRHNSPEFRSACERKRNRACEPIVLTLPSYVDGPAAAMQYFADKKERRKEFRRAGLIAYRRSLREE